MFRIFNNSDATCRLPTIWCVELETNFVPWDFFYRCGRSLPFKYCIRDQFALNEKIKAVLALQKDDGKNLLLARDNSFDDGKLLGPLSRNIFKLVRASL